MVRPPSRSARMEKKLEDIESAIQTQKKEGAFYTMTGTAIPFIILGLAFLPEALGATRGWFVLNSSALLGISIGAFTFAFLPDFSPQFAASQYAAYRQQFFKTTLGFIGIREYPPGRGRGADIDSGPIFLEVGAAATGC